MSPEDEQAVEFAVQDRLGGVPATGIAEHAKRKLVVLGKHALGAQRGGDR